MARIAIVATIASASHAMLYITLAALRLHLLFSYRIERWCRWWCVAFREMMHISLRDSMLQSGRAATLAASPRWWRRHCRMREPPFFLPPGTPRHLRRWFRQTILPLYYMKYYHRLPHSALLRYLADSSDMRCLLHWCDAVFQAISFRYYSISCSLADSFIKYATY